MNKNEKITAVTITRKLNAVGRGMFVTECKELPRQYQVMDELLWKEKGCMIWESELGWICTPFSVKGYDLNGRPNRFKPKVMQLNAGYEMDEMFRDDKLPTLTGEECAIFTDRMDYQEGRIDALTWVRDYVDVTETIRQQVWNQKTPLLGVAGNPKIRRKLQNAFVKITRNVHALFLDSDIRDNLQPIDFNAPYNVNDLQLYRKTLESQMLEMMGVDSKEPTVKKAQTQVDEIEGNDELLNYILADCLRARQRGIDACKDLGLHATTRIQNVVRPMQLMEEGEENGEDSAVETPSG